MQSNSNPRQIIYCLHAKCQCRYRYQLVDGDNQAEYPMDETGTVFHTTGPIISSPVVNIQMCDGYTVHINHRESNYKTRGG